MDAEMTPGSGIDLYFSISLQGLLGIVGLTVAQSVKEKGAALGLNGACFATVLCSVSFISYT